MYGYTENKKLPINPRGVARTFLALAHSAALDGNAGEAREWVILAQQVLTDMKIGIEGVRGAIEY